ncbi:MAG: hypothetical protein Fur006_20940 [Coleofasciculaceae cyanobacterium]
MKQEKAKSQNQEPTAVPNDPTLSKEAVNEVVDEYEKSANVDRPTELDPATQKELGEVERVLEDSALGTDNAL